MREILLIVECNREEPRLLMWMHDPLRRIITDREGRMDVESVTR